MLKRTVLSLIIVLLTATSLSAQSEELSAVIHVLGEDIFFQRANTEVELLLSEGASAPFGIGDAVRTGQNGRIIISINEDIQLLLLPNSHYEIVDFSRDDSGHISLDAQQEGIALHDFNSSIEDFTYFLDATSFSISQAEGQFLVWAVPTGLQAVTVSFGMLTVTKDESDYLITDNKGFAVEGFDIVVPLSPPYMPHKSLDVRLTVRALCPQVAQMACVYGLVLHWIIRL